MIVLVERRRSSETLQQPPHTETLTPRRRGRPVPARTAREAGVGQKITGQPHNAVTDSDGAREAPGEGTQRPEGAGAGLRAAHADAVRGGH